METVANTAHEAVAVVKQIGHTFADRGVAEESGDEFAAAVRFVAAGEAARNKDNLRFLYSLGEFLNAFGDSRGGEVVYNHNFGGRACVGDSLTEGDYGVPGKSGIANVHKENYPYFLARATGAEVRNFGKCGWRASDMLRWYEQGGLNLEGADKIILMLGTNGGQSAEGDSEENRAYRRLAAHIREDQPQAVLYLVTPPNATTDPSYSNCGYAPQVAEAVGFVRRLARELGLPMIDLAASKKITPETESVMQPNDGLHFTETGYRTMAAEIFDAIQ